MNHSIDNYIKDKLQKLGWEDKNLVEKTGLSKGQISKLKNGHVERLTAEVFYKIYKAFGDSCEKATKVVYPDLNLKLDKYISKARNEFGQFMSQFETIKNSTEEIAIKTGIDENRLKDLYYRKAALEAYELLLIEKAIGKKQGELFEEFFGNKI
ncbi:helix-turn-helix transcriptional regulator [Sphingobacterium siyangense]|uniref:helix-turn-helix domain-containing protein n=1 Tax=Sphingobacterium siyangense TaxID=459529 RepID=UPI003017AFEF